MQIVTEADRSLYDDSRQIANARFDYRPTYICYCENDDDVAEALEMAAFQKLKVRVRSGGHQHEGMCSGNGVLIVDLSRINHIEISREWAALGPGAKLADVYEAMGSAGLLFPGGGCGDVRVGGLVQGGGWGPYSRSQGLTCDSLVGFRMVQAPPKLGEAIDVTNDENDPHRTLLWAVRGAGGGNFGVVTNFRFLLDRYSSFITQFTVTWKDKTDKTLVPDVIDDWSKHFPGDGDTRLTSFCRLGTGGDPPALLGGAFLGDPDVCATVLRGLLPKTFARGEMTYQAGIGKRVSQHPDYQPGPSTAAPGHTPNLSDTCAGDPFRHKVSSCFPKTGLGKEAVDIIVRRLGQTATLDNVRRYLSLHCLGGAITNAANRKASCFAWGDKPFMLQYQAWWIDRKDDATCMDWVAGFRDEMHSQGHTVGGFINFPDYDLVPPDILPDRRKALLAQYYGQNLDALIDVKRQYDGDNFFEFPMGIPTK